MLAIDFKTPVEVTLTIIDDSDDDIAEKEREINTTQKDNQQSEEIPQYFEDASKSDKNESTISPQSNVARKRKRKSSPSADTAVDNSAKHTVITTSYGQTHIIVAPPTNTSPPNDATKNDDRFLDNLLKTVSENLIRVMEISQAQQNQDQPNQANMNHLYNLTYSTVVSLILPRENDILFVTRFLKDTLRLCRQKNTLKITNEQQIFPFYMEMIQWTKNLKALLQQRINENVPHISKNTSTPHSNTNIPNTNFSSIEQKNSTGITLPQQSEKQRRNEHVPDFSKNATMPYGNTNIPYTFFSSNGRGNTTGQTNLSLHSSSSYRSAVPPVNNTVINTIPVHLSSHGSLQKTPCGQNPYQQVQQDLCQTAPSGQTPYWQAQQCLPRMTPSAQNSYQRTQYNVSQMKNISQSPYPNMQQVLAQAPRRDNFQRVSQHTGQFNPRNINAGFTAQSHIREDRNRLGQASGVATNLVPIQQSTYQNSYIQHNMQWPPNREPPPYTYSQPPKSVNKEQQPTQAAQRRTPTAQWHHQAEPQQPEVTRSVSTDSGIVSPLPYFSPTDATNSYHLAEEGQATPLITHVTSLNPNVSYNNEDKCSVCFKITKLKCLCSKKYYCSFDCQQSDWGNHSTKCSFENKDEI